MAVEDGRRCDGVIFVLLPGLSPGRNDSKKKVAIHSILDCHLIFVSAPPAVQLLAELIKVTSLLFWLASRAKSSLPLG
jgi:hypothetical protein